MYLLRVLHLAAATCAGALQDHSSRTQLRGDAFLRARTK